MRATTVAQRQPAFAPAAKHFGENVGSRKDGVGLGSRRRRPHVRALLPAALQSQLSTAGGVS